MYVSSDAVELRGLREGGEFFTLFVLTTLAEFLADTGPEVFARNPEVAQAEVLIVECTFIKPGERERARRFGHMHLDDLVAIAPTLANRHVVLTHLSRRHRLGAGTRVIQGALAGVLRPRLHLLNVEWE